ncbi:uncharacterized protein LOC116846078 isoform X2 [Odontomachus brunneus]|uniref:uncharacterized protein LOC116846078 isoform X2 n=1 Tax=Odontomachus brunneus TaxID=486640 RepID=UPI0013F200DB|nr:uncharacterized protein LOC116846078 isoform X2 [Odontomachus brunneus]
MRRIAFVVNIHLPRSPSSIAKTQEKKRENKEEEERRFVPQFSINCRSVQTRCFISRMLNCMRTSYNELQSILLLGKIEQWEAINDKEFQTTNEGESFDYFSKEGEKYLSMAHNLREKNSKLFPRVLKALDNFTRLNAFAKSTNLQDVASLYRYEYFLEKLFAWKAAEDKRKYTRYCKSCGGCECCGRTEHEEIVENKNEHEIMNDEKECDEEIRQNKNKYNKKIAKNKNKYVNGILLEREYDTVMEYEDIVFMFREAEEKSAYGYDYAYSFLKDYCVMFMFFRQLENFRMLVAMIQNLYVEYKRCCLLLHNLMANYCLKANSFLRAQLRSSRKLRRSKEHSMRCKYRYLKQLIARIIEAILLAE